MKGLNLFIKWKQWIANYIINYLMNEPPGWMNFIQ